MTTKQTGEDDFPPMDDEQRAAGMHAWFCACNRPHGYCSYPDCGQGTEDRGACGVFEDYTGPEKGS